jgi:uncharacterized membrane protein YphA (DoxX/SURF4 family)
MTPLRQIQNMLRLTYGMVPIIAGLDKFTNLLANWPAYLSANLSGVLPVSAATFMKVVGIIEIVAGIIVLVRPLIGAYSVMAWLVCIALQLIVGGHYFDVAVRDLVMAIGAFTLAKLTVLADAEFTPQTRTAHGR